MIPENRANPLPLILWLLVQLGALALSAGQVSLAYQFPEPAERLALHVMVLIQIAISALLFPALFKSPTADIVTIACALPFTQLAGFLALEDQSHMLLAMAYVATWMIGLSIWRVALTTPRARMIGVAAATAFALGGPLLWYLRAEFATKSDAANFSQIGVWGPVMGSASVLSDSHLLRPWLVTGVTIASGLLLLICRRILAPSSPQLVHVVHTRGIV